MSAGTILADLPLLLGYRGAMATEMDGADEAALNRIIAILESYLRAAIAEVAFLDCRARPLRFPLRWFHGARDG